MHVKFLACAAREVVGVPPGIFCLSRDSSSMFVFLLSPARLRARDTPKTSQYRGSSECFYRSIILFTLNVSSIVSAVVDVLDLHAAQDATAGQPRTPGTKKLTGVPWVRKFATLRPERSARFETAR